MKSLSNKRLIIVGGVAGGASAAARARRLCEDCEIIMFERGPHVSFANCGLPYFVGGEIAEQDRLLVQTPDSLKARFNLMRASKPRSSASIAPPGASGCASGKPDANTKKPTTHSFSPRAHRQ
jgi:hypothetical protein